MPKTHWGANVCKRFKGKGVYYDIDMVTPPRSERLPPGPVSYPESGQVVIRLEESIQSDAPNLPTLIHDEAMTELGQLLARFENTFRENIFSERVFDHLPPAELRKRAAVSEPGANRRLKSLGNYWRLDFRSAGNIEEVLKKLRKTPGIAIAYQETPVIDAQPRGLPTLRDPYANDQKLLGNGPAGIDVGAVWCRNNGMGQGVKVVDVESGWIENHEDLPPFEVLSGTNGVETGYSSGVHGAKALGVVGAPINGKGLVGIAPLLESLNVASHYDKTKISRWPINSPFAALPGSDMHVGKAIAEAILRLDRGDIIYVEVERLQGDRKYPAEIDSASLRAIREAFERDIIVIEAAGNNALDTSLDDWTDPNSEHSLNQDADPDANSGAIIVGACKSAVVSAPDYRGHKRYDTSNFGSRVDCYAWGQWVYSAGGTFANTPATARDSYTNSFGQTSAATAIIAGAVAILQSWYKSRCGEPLTPTQMRTILSDEATATKQVDINGQPIGVMPDLDKILKSRWLFWQVLAGSARRLSRGFGPRR